MQIVCTFVCCADWKMVFYLWNCSHLCQVVSVEFANRYRCDKKLV